MLLQMPRTTEDKQAHNPTISARIDPGAKARLEQLAEQTGRPMSQIIDLACRMVGEFSADEVNKRIMRLAKSR